MTQKEQILELLNLHFGYKELRNGQEQAIDNLLAGISTLVIMPTGGGKSLCYQLPALVLEGVTIVISPLISLMKDQVDSLNAVGIPAAYINSSLSLEQVNQELVKVRNNYYKLLYVAPERFYSREFINTLNSVKISLFAIDEAHCISHWGHDFRPSYTRLAGAISNLGNPPVIALTATATEEVKKDIIKQLNLDNPSYIITGFARPNLQFGVIQANNEQKLQLILNIVWKTKEGAGIIYAGTRKSVEDVLSALRSAGIKAIGYHAGMTQDERKIVQENFMQGRVNFVVATNAFGMGIDKSNIRFVIHYNIPGTLEAYYQEVGRAGRDGLNSSCFMFYHPRDRYLHEFFIKGDNPSEKIITDLYDYLISQNSDNLLVTYAQLKEQLGEDVPEMCIGTSIKILENAGYIARANEKAGNTYFKLNVSLDEAIKTLGKRSPKSHAIITKLYENFKDEIENGTDINFEIIESIVGAKKDSIVRVLKKLAETSVAEYNPPFRGTEIKILKKIDPLELEIDYKVLKEKLNHAYAKLDKMENFVYNLGCRQKYILDYFGDNNPYECGKCDNCLNTNVYFNKSAQQPKKEYLKEKDYTEIKTKSIDPKIKINTKLTQLTTLDLWLDDLNIAEIAAKRELATETIANHLCYLIEKGLIKESNYNKIISNNKVHKIIKAIKEVGVDKLTPIKEALGDEFNWEEIKLAKAIYLKRGQ